eukprot:4502697-Amphidinium_carterae.2
MLGASQGVMVYPPQGAIVFVRPMRDYGIPFHPFGGQGIPPGAFALQRTWTQSSSTAAASSMTGSSASSPPVPDALDNFLSITGSLRAERRHRGGV